MKSNWISSTKTAIKKFNLRRLGEFVYWTWLHQLDVFSGRLLVNYDETKKPVIYAMWHGNQWGLGTFPKKDRKDIHILVSKSNDGEIISKICRLLGFSIIRGSHKRGGDKALREMIAKTKEGKSIAFMVDGPKGPKQKVKKGIIKIAKLAQVPIIPIVAYTKDKFVFNSWDNYEIPKNFSSRFALVFGEPITVPEDATDEIENELRLQIEQELFNLNEKIQIEYNKKWEKQNG